MIKRWSLDCGPPATTSSVALGTSQCVSAHVSVSVGWGATDHASLDELTPRTQQSPTQNYDVLQARVQSRLSTGKRATGGTRHKLPRVLSWWHHTEHAQFLQ